MVYDIAVTFIAWSLETLQRPFRSAGSSSPMFVNSYKPLDAPRPTFQVLPGMTCHTWQCTVPGRPLGTPSRWAHWGRQRRGAWTQGP